MIQYTDTDVIGVYQMCFHAYIASVHLFEPKILSYIKAPADNSKRRNLIGYTNQIDTFVLPIAGKSTL